MSLSRLSCLVHHCGRACGATAPRGLSAALGEDRRRVGSSAPLRGPLAAAGGKPDWNRAVSEAEKIVGYPNSFLSLRWLLSDEIANVALHLRKLVGSNHPLLKTAKYLYLFHTLFDTSLTNQPACTFMQQALVFDLLLSGPGLLSCHGERRSRTSFVLRNLIYNGKNNMQAWGLIVLLVSKAAGHTPDIPDMEQDKSAGVLHSQRALAEVTEMIRTSHLVHKGLVNMQPQQGSEENANDMTFGNKIALLSGDYLLANSCSELANLRNQELVELMSSAVRDLAEAEFVGERDYQNNPLPSRPVPKDQAEPASEWTSVLEPFPMLGVLGSARREWSARHVLSAGALLGKSCSGALKLAGHGRALQTQGYLFGCHLALAWQAFLDLEAFSGPEPATFSLVGAPLAFTLDAHPHLYSYIEAGKQSVNRVDYHALYAAVLEGSGIEQTKQLQHEHISAAVRVLNEFPDCDARTALANIIVAMQGV